MKIQPLRAPVLRNCRGSYALFAEAEVTVSDTELHGTSWIGFGSHMNSGLIRSYCQIGRYCSIGRNVTIGLGHRDLSVLSTSSWFPAVGPSTLPLAQKDPKRRVIIGHDVWIGDDVKISSGVTIGTGAVLAASSVVTRDVAPYEIVGGVPARSIKTRWPDELVRALLDSEWWSYDPHVLREIHDAVPEIVLERLKERSSSAARFEPKHVKLTPAPAPITPIPEIPAAAELERAGPALLSANTFSPLQARPGLGYRADLRFAEPIEDEGLVWEVRTNQGLVQRRFLTRGDRDKFVFFRMPADQHQVTMRVCDEAGKTHDLEVDRVALKEVDFHDADGSFAFSDDTVVACIASYPPRREMLKATIETLIDQVDHVCVYLNGYKDVPDHILEWAATGRLSYVISSENRLRAAAKFLWLDRPGYFLLCDDDILFPPDYAAVMRRTLDEKGRKAVIGLMAVAFGKTPEGLTTRKTYTAFNEACGTARRVHLLGTGVMALHSDAVAHMDHARLLSEPIDNDEIFAIEAQRCGVPLWCVERTAHWVRPNPNMIYGIREEVAIDPSKRLHRSRLLSSVAVWPDLDPAPLQGFVPNKTVLANFESAVDKLAECNTERLSVLQIGACDGVQFDPLNALVRRHNLCGLFFEPVRYLFEALQQTYKDQEDCVFVNMAISDKTGQATLRYVDPKAIEDGKVPGWSTGLGTLVEGANAIDGAGGVADETMRAIAQHTLSERVRTLSFDELAKWSHCADLDILVTDAEGYDAYFLERLAEGVMRPRIVLSETMLLSKARVTELRNGLIACGYEVICGEEYLLAKLGNV